MAKRKRPTTENEKLSVEFGATREQVEQKLQEAYAAKVNYIKMIDMLDGSIQTMEFVLNGLDKSAGDIAEDKK